MARIVMKFGISSTSPGIISGPSAIINSIPLPKNCILENANAARLEVSTTLTVTVIETSSELKKYRPNGAPFQASTKFCQTHCSGMNDPKKTSRCSLNAPSSMKISGPKKIIATSRLRPPCSHWSRAAALRFE
mgnify:CR=1 FL=1